MALIDQNSIKTHYGMHVDRRRLNNDVMHVECKEIGKNLGIYQGLFGSAIFDSAVFNECIQIMHSSSLFKLLHLDNIH